MEDTHIIMLNTSMFGKNLVPTPTSGSDKPTSTDSGCGVDGFLGKICGSATSAAASAVSEVGDKLDDIADDIADKLADKLGIKEFYSLHVLDACEGEFSPNATTPGAGYNVTKCTKPLKTGEYNVTKMFDHELQVGPLNLNLADLGFTKDLQKQFDKIPRILLALAVVYILAVGFTGTAFLAAAAAMVLLPSYGRSRALVLVNFGIATLGFLTLLAGSLVTTIGASLLVDKINESGKDIGLTATVGRKFLGLTWAAVGPMLLVLGYWVWELSESKRYGTRQRLREKYEISGPQYVTRY